MNNFQDLIFEYNGILDFVKECAESGLEEFVELEERLSSFGENLNNFFVSSLKEIDTLKKELNSQKLEADEIIAKLNKKLESLSGTMTDGDYKLCSIACKKDYAQYWDLLEENSKKFLITSYFILKKISATKYDFSTVVLCLCKPFENEIHSKIFLPFITNESELPIIETDISKLRETIENCKKYKTFYISFKMMVVNFRKPRYPISYAKRLHDMLNKNQWDMVVLGSEKFIVDSMEYMEAYRNKAAHISVLEEQIAINCKTKTREMLTRFLSTHPKSK